MSREVHVRFREGVGVKFLRATRLLVLVKRERAGQRVMASLRRFLGFMFRRKKIVWSEKSEAQFKRRVKELTGRSWGVSMCQPGRPRPQGEIQSNLAVLLVPGLPKREVGGVLLVVFVLRHPCAGPQAAAVEVPQFAVFREGRDAAVNRAVVRTVGKPRSRKGARST